MLPAELEELFELMLGGRREGSGHKKAKRLKVEGMQWRDLA